MSPREQYLEEKVKHLLDIIKGLEIDLEQAVGDLRSAEVEAYRAGYQGGLVDSSYER